MVVECDELGKVTKSRRLHNFINISDSLQDLNINKSTIPAYNPRKSRSDLKKIAGHDGKLLAKIAKKPLKKATIRVPKAARRLTDSPSARSPVTETSSESDSSDASDDSEDGLEILEPSPFPKVRPDGPLEATWWDSGTSVWRARQLTLTDSDVHDGLRGFWEVVKTIKERWSTDKEAVKKAQESNKESELPLLRHRVKNQRDMVEMAFQTAVKYGHPNIVKYFGEHKPLMSACSVFLLDRFRENEADGSLSKCILEFLSRCTTLPTETIEATNMNKVLQRLTKRSDEKTKSLAKQILSNGAVAAKKKKLGESAGSEAPTKADSPRKEAIQRKEQGQIAGSKRVHGGDGVTQNPAKRVSSSSGAIPSSSTTSTKPVTAAPKRPTPTEKSQSSTPAVVSAPKVRQVVSKTPSLFASLQSASKRPVPANGGNNAAQKKTTPAASDTEKKPPAAPVAPVKKFSFKETLAQLSKPQEPKTVKKKEESAPPETPEERAKRLRKEERRKLRVAFKPDHSLVEVRVFEHEAEEEQGHDYSQVRDVTDLRSEGRMFKKHHNDMMDMDGDDDEDGPPLGFIEFKEPSGTFFPINLDFILTFTAIDFGGFNAGVNYAPYGGATQEPQSEEKAAREKYEADTLMVFYTHPSDIPPCPLEPVGIDADGLSDTPVVHFALPQQKDGSAQPVQGVLPQYGMASAQPGDYNSVEQVFQNFAQPTAVASMQPTQQQEQQPAAPDIQALLAALTAASAQTTQTPFPTLPAAAPAPPASFDPTNLSNILAMLPQSNNPPAQNPMNFPFTAMPSQSSHTVQPYEDPGRKRLREGDTEDGEDSHNYNGTHNQGFGKNKKRKQGKGVSTSYIFLRTSLLICHAESVL